VLYKKAEKLARYEVGVVETGRSHVFIGYFVKITLWEDEEVVAEDCGSMLRALRSIVCNISPRGIRLNCVGLSGEWNQSGLSENTGWGYFGGEQRLMHMMEKMPAKADEPLDRMVTEAVEGMRIGLD
jgi:hypothetical protein